MDLSANKLEAEPEIPVNSAQEGVEKHDDEDGKKLWRGKKPFKKQIYTTILQQIEFYFSSSNLAKDRFMSKMIQEDKCKLFN